MPARWIPVAAGMMGLALCGCAPRGSVQVSQLTHSGYKAFRGGGVVEFKELGKPVLIAVNGQSVLIWEGRYLSPFEWCMARSMSVCVVAVTRTGTTRMATTQEDTVQVRGFLYNPIGPIARVEMRLSRNPDVAASEEFVAEGPLRTDPVINDDVYVWPDENGEDWTTRDLPERLRGKKEWYGDHARMRVHIIWPTARGTEKAAEDILRRYRLRLSDDGNLELRLAK